MIKNIQFYKIIQRITAFNSENSMINSQIYKQTLLYSTILIALYSSWCAFSFYNQVKMEKLSYKTIGNLTGSLQKFMGIKTLRYFHQNVQIRQYSSFIAIEAYYPGVTFQTAINFALQDIGMYLMGKNYENRKLQMSAPYIIQKNSIENSYTISFVMPDYSKINDLPKPIDRRLRIKQIGSRKLVAKIWRGNLPNEEIIERKKKILQKHLQYSQYQLVGNLKVFQYDSPMTPGFIRKNQVLFEVREKIFQSK